MVRVAMKPISTLMRPLLMYGCTATEDAYRTWTSPASNAVIEGPTPPGFPRRVGVAKKRPLA